MKSQALEALLSAGLLSGLAWSLITRSAEAQYSPNCLRNHKKDYCAITLATGGTNEQEGFDQITFSDHTVYEVVRNEESCKKITERAIKCDARIISRSGNPEPIHAYYRGTAYEGGYKHEYIGKGIHLTYFFLD